jgi:hypothetical protein
MKIKNVKHTIAGKTLVSNVAQFENIQEAIQVLEEPNVLDLINRAHKNTQLNLEKAQKLRVDTQAAVASYLRSAVNSLTSPEEFTKFATALGTTPLVLKHLIGDTE